MLPPPSVKDASLWRTHLRHLTARLRRSVFVGNVLVVMSGTALAQVIGFALTPIISRLFSPTDFGVYGSFAAVCAIIAAGVTLEYTQAIMLPKEESDAVNLFMIACVSTVVVGFLCLCFCVVAPAVVQGVTRTNGGWSLALLVVATLVTGINNSCQAWCVRMKAFRSTAGSQVIRSLSANGTQIGLGYLKGGASGLIVGNVLGDALASLNLIRVLLPDVLRLRSSIRWERMKLLAKEFRDFPLYAASQNVINALSQGLPVFLLIYFYGIAVAGAYAFGVRILAVPMGFVSRALRQVLFQKACETHHRGGSLVPLYVKITAGLFAVAFFPSLVLFVWAPQIFVWIFGPQWHVAGEFARSLMLWMLFAFCNLPAVLFARIIRIQRAFFFYDLALLAARAAVLVLGGLYLTALPSVMLFSVVGAGMNLFLIVLVGRALMRQEGRASLESIRECLVENKGSRSS